MIKASNTSVNQRLCTYRQYNKTLKELQISQQQDLHTFRVFVLTNLGFSDKTNQVWTFYLSHFQLKVQQAVGYVTDLTVNSNFIPK